MSDTVKKIVSEYLEKWEYDGLHNDHGCSCKKDDLMHCKVTQHKIVNRIEFRYI